MLIIPALLACLALAFYLFSGRYVTTDNAYIGAQKVLITPEVSGKVVNIAVQEGQLLKQGDELFAIDPVAYRLAAQRRRRNWLGSRPTSKTSRATTLVLASRSNCRDKPWMRLSPTTTASWRC